MKLAKYIPLIIVVAGIALRYIAYWCVNATSCSLSSFFWPLFFTFIKPLYLYALIFGLVAIILCFVTPRAFKSWLRFALWWLPLSAILIALTPNYDNSAFSYFTLVKETTATFMAVLFTIISLIIILRKSFPVGTPVKK